MIGQSAENAHKKTGEDRPGHLQSRHTNHSAAIPSPQPISQKLAAEILVHQANEIQTIARDFIRQGHPTADLNLLQRAARAVVVTGTLLERLGGAHEDD